MHVQTRVACIPRHAPKLRRHMCVCNRTLARAGALSAWTSGLDWQARSVAAWVRSGAARTHCGVSGARQHGRPKGGRKQQLAAAPCLRNSRQAGVLTQARLGCVPVTGGDIGRSSRGPPTYQLKGSSGLEHHEAAPGSTACRTASGQGSLMMRRTGRTGVLQGAGRGQRKQCAGRGPEVGPRAGARGGGGKAAAA